MKDFQERVHFVLLRVRSNNQGQERKPLEVKVLLVDCVIAHINQRGLNREKGVTVIPAEELLSLLLQKRAGTIC
jgi:hypothetical protein